MVKQMRKSQWRHLFKKRRYYVTGQHVVVIGEHIEGEKKKILTWY